MVQKLERPILIMHGDEDEVVDIEHAYRLKIMLDKFNKPYEWYVFQGGVHGFTKTKSIVELHSRLTKFIDHYLK